MKVTPVQTPVITAETDLLEVIATSIDALKEYSVVVVTSKVVALTEGRCVSAEDHTSKHELVRGESEHYLNPLAGAEYPSIVTVHHGILGLSAGVDASNSFDKQYILLPEDAHASAAKIWHFLKEKYQVTNIGVVITDSVTRPMRWGVVGIALGYAGFIGVADKRGDVDLSDEELKVTTVSVVDSLAAAAVVTMGEAAERTPLCLLEDLEDVVDFCDAAHDKQDVGTASIFGEEDQYYALYAAADWQKGNK